MPAKVPAQLSGLVKHRSQPTLRNMPRKTQDGDTVSEYLRDDLGWVYCTGLGEDEKRLIPKGKFPLSWKRASLRKTWLEDKRDNFPAGFHGSGPQWHETQAALTNICGQDPRHTWKFIRRWNQDKQEWEYLHELHDDKPERKNDFHNIYK
ncbi:hypothetical protein [Polynucleobacter sp.]